MKIKAYGKLTDILSDDLVEIDFRQGKVKEFKNKLIELYPALKSMSYLVVQEDKYLQDADEIITDAEIALLPPFSGG